MRRRTQRLIKALLVLASAGWTGAATAQSVDEQLDIYTYLRGLVELRAIEALTQYLQTSEPRTQNDSLIRQIEAERMKLVTRDLPADARGALIDSILAARDKLVKSSADDPRSVVWLIDQAEDAYLHVLHRDGLAITVLFGLASEEGQDAARNAADRMHSSASLALRRIPETLLALEQSSEFDALHERLRSRIVQQDRSTRAPLLQGIGACVQASLDDLAPERSRALFDSATQALAPLVEEIQGPLLSHARLYLGIAFHARGDYGAAARQFEEVLVDPQADLSTRFASRLSLAKLRAKTTDVTSALSACSTLAAESHSPVAFRVLAADQYALLAERAGKSQDACVTAHRMCIESSPFEQRAGVESIVLQRLARLINRSSWQHNNLTNTLLVIAWARASAEVATDRTDAARLVIDLLDRTEVSTADHALAQLELARIRLMENDRVAARDTFLDLARMHTSHWRAKEAMASALSLAKQLHDEHTANETHRERYMACLQLLLTQYPMFPDIDQWQYEAGRVAVGAGRLTDALVALTKIPRHSNVRPHAVVLIVEIQRRLHAQAESPARAAELLQAIVDACRVSRDELAARQDFGAHDVLIHLETQLAVYEAEALLLQHRPIQAIDAANAIEVHDGMPVKLSSDILRIKVDAYRAGEKFEDARKEIEDFAQRAPEHALTAAMSLLRDLRAAMLASSFSDDVPSPSSNQLQIATSVADIIESIQLAAHDRDSTDTLVLADVRRLGQDWSRASEAYEHVLQATPDSLEALFGKAECLFHESDDVSDLGDAMRIYKRIASARSLDEDLYFWTAQLRMMQILDRTQRSTNGIAPRIRRLQQRDTSMGSRELKRGFTRLLNKYG